MKRNSSIYYFVSSVISGISGFILISIITKNFPPEDYGYYSLIITTVSLTTTVLISWISQSTLRFYEELALDSKENQVASTMLLITLGINIILFIVISFLWLLLKEASNVIFTNISIYLTALFFLPESFYLVLNTILRAKNNSRLYSISVIFYTCLKLLITFVYIVRGGNNINDIILWYSFTGAIISLFMFLNLIRYIKISIKYFSLNLLNRFIKYGVPLIGLASMQWILASSDRYIIGLFRNSKELGLYSLSYSLATNIFNILTTFFLLSAYPKIISSMNKNGMEGASKSIGIHLRYYFLIIFPVFWGIAALSKELLVFISSVEYLAGETTLIITSLSMLIYGVTFYYNKAWELNKNTKVIFFHSLYAGLFNIFLNLLLVPRYGYEAAVYTTLVSYILYFLITFFRSRKQLKIEVDIKSTSKIIIASFLMYLSVKWYSSNVSSAWSHLIVAILLGTIVYTVLLGISHEITEEIKIIKSNITRARYKIKQITK